MTTLGCLAKTESVTGVEAGVTGVGAVVEDVGGAPVGRVEGEPPPVVGVEGDVVGATDSSSAAGAGLAQPARISAAKTNRTAQRTTKQPSGGAFTFAVGSLYAHHTFTAGRRLAGQ